jgi:hypothetical protein
MIGAIGGGAGAGAGANTGGGAGAGANTRGGAGAGTAAWIGAGAGAGACTGAAAGAGAGGAAGAGAGMCAGATTLWLRLGRVLADGRMLNASEITSPITPVTNTMSTPIATRNGLRLSGSCSSRPKSGYIPVVKSSGS